jgi:hypothetical protein
VRNAAAAVDALGGEAGLGRCRADGTSVTLRLRPGDALAHPLCSEQRNCAGLLLRLGGGGAVAARVDSGYRFAGLADAQYLSAPPPKRPRLAASADDFADAADAVEEAGEAAPLLLVPPFFFRSDAPQDYAFRAYAAAEEAAADASGAAPALAGAARGSPPVTHEIDFRASGVPAALPTGSEWAAPPEVAALLGRLFEERGIWSTAAIMRALPREAATAARKFLPSHAYRFLNGPWHRLWVRRGLDPRTDAAARRWQCFDYRLPKEWYPPTRGKARAEGGEGDAPGAEAQGAAAAAAQPGSADFAAVHALRALPARRTTFFQLCDLVHPDIAALIGREPPERTACNEHCGWFRKATLDAVKALLREAFDALAAAQGLHVQPPKPRKNTKTSKAAKVAAVLADARAAMLAAAGGPVDGDDAEDGADEDGEEEEEEAEEEEHEHEHHEAVVPAATLAAAPPIGDAAAGRGNDSGSDYSVFGDAD